MKANYNTPLIAYESFQNDIYSILMNIATEGDETSIQKNAATKTTSNSDPSNANQAIANTNLVTRISEIVKKLMQKIGEILEALKRKLSNRIRLLKETDKGFYNLYYRRKSMIKPYPNIRKTTYQYIDQLLENPMQRLMGDVNNCLLALSKIDSEPNYSQRVSDILEAPQGKMIQILFEPYTKNSDIEIDTVAKFAKYIIELYRGEKKEIVINSSRLPEIERMAMSTRDLESRCNSYLSQANSTYNRIKLLPSQIIRVNKDPKMLNLISANVSKAAELYNAYSTLVHIYYEAKLEQSLNYRLLLKAFYQF